MLDDRWNGLRSKTKSKLHEKQSKLRDALIKEYGEEKGATTLMRQVDTAEAKLKELKLAISQLGFDYREGNLCLSDDGDNSLDKLIDERAKKDLGIEDDDIDARFDRAQVAMMTVASLEDAEKLLKSVTEV